MKRKGEKCDVGSGWEEGETIDVGEYSYLIICAIILNKNIEHIAPFSCKKALAFHRHLQLRYVYARRVESPHFFMVDEGLIPGAEVVIFLFTSSLCTTQFPIP